MNRLSKENKLTIRTLKEYILTRVQLVVKYDPKRALLVSEIALKELLAVLTISEASTWFLDCLSRGSDMLTIDYINRLNNNL